MESSRPASPRGATADASPGGLVSPTDSPAAPASHPECRRAELTSLPSSAGRRTANSESHLAARESFPNPGRSFLARCSLREAGGAGGSSRIDVGTRSIALTHRWRLAAKRRWDVGDQVFFAQARSAHLRCLPPDRTLGRLVMMMHVMFVDVHFVDK